MSTEDLIDDKELVVVMTGAGYVKTVDADAFRAVRRGAKGVAGTRLREDDLVSHLVYTTAHAYLLFFSNRGKVYRLRAHEIPERERAAKGLPIVNLLPLAPDEHIQAIIDTREFGTERFLFFATKKGVVKKTAFHEYDSSRRDGLIAINLRDGDELVRVIVTDGTDDIFMVGGSGMTIRFAEADVRAMGRAASGVRGMKLRVDDEVVSVDVARDETSILMVTESGYGKRTQLDRFNRQGRGGQGVRGIKLTARKGRVVSAFMVGLEDEVVRHLLGRHHGAHPRARHLLPGSGRHRRAGDEPGSRAGRGGGRTHPGHQRRRRRLTARPDFPEALPPQPNTDVGGGAWDERVWTSRVRRCRSCWGCSPWRW